MPSYAVLTCALHEHTYINAFISHYVNLGFNAIYILCDKFQPKYDSYIHKDYSAYVHLIHMNYSILYNLSFDAIQIQHYRKTIASMNYDWIFLCDMDEFLYLPNQNTISNFINPLLTTIPDLAQISFPWMIVDSILENDYIHMFDQLNHHKWYINPHVKSIFKKSSLVYKKNTLQLSTHCAMVNGRTYLQSAGFNQPFQLNSIYHNRFHLDFYQKNAFIIHFHTRSFKNNIIKLCNSCHKSSDYKLGLRRKRYT